MSHTGGEALGAAVALRLSVATVFWLCGIVHLQRLVFGREEVCDLDGPVDGMHMAMAVYMAFMFCPGYSGRTDGPAAAVFLGMTAALAVRAVRHGADSGKALRSAIAATGGAGMAYMLLTDSGNAVGVALALLLAACSGGGATTVWNGQAVDASSLLLRDTLAGDATLDGLVDFNDLARLAQNYNSPAGGTWAGGDFTYDDVVDFNDLAKLAQLSRAPGATDQPPVLVSGLGGTLLLDGRAEEASAFEGDIASGALEDVDTNFGRGGPGRGRSAPARAP